MRRHLGLSIDNVGLDFVMKNNIYWLQISNKFSEPSDIASLIRMAKRNPIKISYISPVFYQRDPDKIYFLSSNKRLRKASFDILEINLKMAKSLPTDHIVIKLVSNETNKDIDKGLMLDTIKKLNILSEENDIKILIYMENYELFENSKKLSELLEGTNVKIALDMDGFYNYTKSKKMEYNDELDRIFDYIHILNISLDTEYFVIKNMLETIKNKGLDVPVILKTETNMKDKHIYDKINYVSSVLFDDELLIKEVK